MFPPFPSKLVEGGEQFLSKFFNILDNSLYIENDQFSVINVNLIKSMSRITT